MTEDLTHLTKASGADLRSHLAAICGKLGKAATRQWSLVYGRSR
jgi:hypothetical protein